MKLASALLASALLALLLAACWTPTHPLRLRGEAVGGGLLRGQAPDGVAVFIDGAKVSLSPQGHFAYGFARQPRRAHITLEARRGEAVIWQEDIPVAARAYLTQRIDGLADALVSPPEEVWPRLAAEKKRKQQARAQEITGDWFGQDFLWPVKGVITGVYGSQRILNGQKRAPHYGIDIAAAEGTPVLAPAGGIVILAQDDFYFEGGLVFLHHGGDVVSAFLHLSELAVSEGQNLARGDVVGAVGASGRASGAHLDYRLYWRALALDPALILAK